jgi:23S rRNA pseudouridine1911/1915/1917 synthase
MSKSVSPEIIFENDSFIALNKPAGMLSIPDREQSEPSLKDILIWQHLHYSSFR